MSCVTSVEVVSGEDVPSLTVVSAAPSTLTALSPDEVSGTPASEMVGASPPAHTGLGPSSAVSQPAAIMAIRVKGIRIRWFKVASSGRGLCSVMLRMLGSCAKRVHRHARLLARDRALYDPR